MVLIKDMEKPKVCGDCPLFYDLIYCNALELHHSKLDIDWLEGVDSRCPIVEVVPYGPEGTLYKET